MIISLFLLFGIVTTGVVGYQVLENMTLLEAVYMTVITISTVGFSEVRHLSDAGRVLTIIIITTWNTIGAYTIGNLFRTLVEGELLKTFGRKKLDKKIAELSNHHIVCGYGRIGKLICRELNRHGMHFVVIENDPASTPLLEQERYLFLPKDATSDDVLLEARIMRARALVTVLKADADNVFTTLTAKGLRPDIYILARASDEKSTSKLKRAGANRVDLPYDIGGRRMAQALIKPAVGDFLDLATMGMDDSLGLAMEETRIREGSSLVGKNLIESNLRRDFGVIIVAIRKNSGEMIFNPTPGETLGANDVIVVLGKRADLVRMNDTM